MTLTCPPGQGLEITPIPVLAPDSKAAESYQSLNTEFQQSLKSLTLKCHQSLSLPKNQITNIHQSQATLESSPPSPEILCKIYTLFSLLLFLT